MNTLLKDLSLDAYSIRPANPTGVDEPLQINAVTSTPGLFRTLAVQLADGLPSASG